MGVKRSDFKTNGRRTRREIWEQEVQYRMSRVLEHLEVIEEMARVPEPVWNPEQPAAVCVALRDRATQIGNAYAKPLRNGLFEFPDQTQLQSP